ncbi:MAG: aminotransferase class V-fold PLP-dependent enzyme [Pseudomonadales bacterium]|nr:aminotransferase class V-fold PLP-dependent enzyme [Pseudomonadales bacterium]
MATTKIDLQNEFPQERNNIYLNHAAVSPWPQRTQKALQDFIAENVALGASRYPNWLRTESTLRAQLAEMINAPSPKDIALLKNTSEGLSVIAYGLDWQAGDNIVITNHEFPSNRIVWESLKSKGVDVRVANLDVDRSKQSPENSIIDSTDDRTRLVSISSVQYASGIALDLQAIGTHCKTHNIFFCVDAIQSIGALQFDCKAIYADAVIADGHKWMLGPEGLALFYCSPKLRDQLTLNQYGWHMIENQGDYDKQEWEVAKSSRRFECGSPNMLGIYALSASLSLLLEFGMVNVENQLRQNMQLLIDGLKTINNLDFLSPIQTDYRAGIVTVTIPGCDSLSLYNRLKKNNVICAHRGGGIRFSPHFYTPKEKILSAVDTLHELVTS